MLVPSLWQTKMCAGYVNNAAGSARPLLLKNDFGYDAAQLGRLMSAMFFANALVGLRLGRITELLGGALETIVRCLCGMMTLYVILGCTFEPRLGAPGRATPENGVWLYLLLGVGLSMMQFPLATTITAKSTALVPPELKGTLVGIEHATFSLAGLFGPQAGVYLLERGGLSAVAYAAAAVYAVLFAAWRLHAWG